MKPDWLSKKGIAAETDETGLRTVHDWIHKRGLRYVKVGGRILVKRAWLDEFLESHEDKTVDRIVDDALKGLE